MGLHAKKSVALLKDLKRSRWLPPFNDKQIKEVVQEIYSDSKEIKRIAQEHGLEGEPSSEAVLGLILYNDLIDQNRRCLLAYLNYRIERVRELRWEVGLRVPEDKIEKLHDNEKLYMHSYNNILDRYMKRYVPDAKGALDLTACWDPPEMDAQCRILVHNDGLGDLVTEDSGVVKLKKGYMVYVKKTDVERLIRAGKVEHVKTCMRECAAEQ